MRYGGPRTVGFPVGVCGGVFVGVLVFWSGFSVFFVLVMDYSVLDSPPELD